jgi:hypothetical protein
LLEEAVKQRKKVKKRGETSESKDKAEAS